MGDSLFEDVIKMILPVKALVEEATSYVESEVKTVLQHRITDKKRIEKLLDQLLNYADMSDKADNLLNLTFEKSPASVGGEMNRIPYSYVGHWLVLSHFPI